MKTRRTIRTLVWGLLLSVGLGALGGALGLVAGAFFGGNFASSVQLFGLRGYEATGYLGMLLGAAAGVLGGAYGATRRYKSD
jgi:hypothetical protein